MHTVQETWAKFQSLARTDGPLLPVAVLILGMLVRMPQIYDGLGELYLFRQAQTAFAARQFAREGLGAGPGPVHVFGEGSQVPFELPLFQILVGLISQTGLSVQVSGRVLALVLFQLSAILFYLILRDAVGRKVAVVFLALSQSVPYGIIWSTAFLIEFLAVAAGFASIYFFMRFIKDSSRLAYYLPALFFGAVTGLVKGTTLIPVLAFLGVIALSKIFTDSEFKGGLRVAILGIGFAIFSIGSGLAWTSFADSVKASSPLTAWLTSSNLQEWNYGTLGQRTSFGDWERLVQFVEPILLSPILVIAMGILVLSPILSRGEKTFAFALIASAASGPAIFWNLYVVHSYYLTAIFFQLVALLALVSVRTIQSLRREGGHTGALLATVAIIVFLTASFADGSTRFQLTSVYSQRSFTAQSQDIIAHIPSREPILIFNCDWDPTIAWETDRSVLMFRDPANPLTLQESKIKELLHSDLREYRYVVDCVGFEKEQFSGGASWLEPVSTYVSQIRVP